MRENLGLIVYNYFINQFKDRVEEKFNEISKLISLEMGKPITQAENEVKSTLNNIKWDLDNANECISPETTFENNFEVKKVFYEPRGIVVTISPFNYLFSLLKQLMKQLNSLMIQFMV